MERKLFSNAIIVNTSVDIIRQILTDNFEIQNFDSYIESIEPLESNEYIILQNFGLLLDRTYIVVIERNIKNITYLCSSTELDYQVIWELSKVGSVATKVTEQVILSRWSRFSINKVVKPILEDKYSQALVSLKNICESKFQGSKGKSPIVNSLTKEIR